VQSISGIPQRILFMEIAPEQGTKGAMADRFDY
jgi:hypothetical protein